MINDVMIRKLPVFSLIVLQALVGYAYLTVMMKLVYEEFVFFSLDVQWGGFGFLNSDEAFAAMFCYGLSWWFGSAGYTICLCFFSPVIVTASYLLEPFIGQMIGYLMDIDKLPGKLTWLGTVLVLVGILLIQKADR